MKTTAKERADVREEIKRETATAVRVWTSTLVGLLDDADRAAALEQLARDLREALTKAEAKLRDASSGLHMEYKRCNCYSQMVKHPTCTKRTLLRREIDDAAMDARGALSRCSGVLDDKETTK